MTSSYYQRRLPHWHPRDAYLFVTWRLADSLPRGAGGFACRKIDSGRAFVSVDRVIDRAACGPKWLADPRIAQLVVETIHIGHRERSFYELCAYVVMPNHVHVLFRPFQPVPRIMRWLKGSTARKANQVLGRTGERFWQDESYDHWVRNDREFVKIVRYIEWNPVAAGLVRSVEEWPWTSGLAGGTACPTS